MYVKLCGWHASLPISTRTCAYQPFTNVRAVSAWATASHTHMVKPTNIPGNSSSASHGREEAVLSEFPNEENVACFRYCRPSMSIISGFKTSIRRVLSKWRARPACSHVMLLAMNIINRSHVTCLHQWAAS